MPATTGLSEKCNFEMELLALHPLARDNRFNNTNMSEVDHLDDTHIFSLVSTAQFPEYTSSDNEDEEDTIDAPSVKSVFIVVYTLLAVSCIVGNGLVLVVMTRCPSMRTRTNIFLCHLAAADLGVGIICIVPSLLVGILATWFAGPMGLFLCKFYNFMEEFNLTVSILLHVLMALERYVAIIHPFVARRLFTRCRMYSILVIIWTAAGLHNLPLLFLYGTETTPSGKSYCFKFWTMNIDLPLYVTLNFVLTYLLPLICMSAMYIRISFVLWRSSPHKLLQPDTSTARFGNAHPSTERVSGVAAEGVNCASSKVSQVHGQSADRKYVPLTRTGDRRDNKDDTNVNDAALVTHTSNNSSGGKGDQGDDSLYRYLGEEGSSSEEDEDGSQAVSCGEQTDKGVRRCRRCSRQSRTSCSSSSACTSITTIEDNIPACLNEIYCVDGSGGGTLSDTTRTTMTTTTTTTTLSLATFPQAVSGNLATPLLPAQPGAATMSKVVTSTLTHPSSSSGSAAAAMLPTSASGDGVYVLRRGNSANTSFRFRVTSHRVLTMRRKVVRLLIAVLLVFALSVLPHHIRAISRVWLLPGSSFWLSGVSKYMMKIMLFLNSTLNPLLYSIMSDSFRRSARQVLCCQKRKPPAAIYAAAAMPRGVAYRSAAAHRDLF